MGVHAMGRWQTSRRGRVWDRKIRGRPAHPIRRAGRRAYRFFMRGGEGVLFSRPLLFWLSVLVALDGSIRIPSHRSEIQAEGQNRNGTRGKPDAHEGRSNQTSRNRHGIQSHLISHHRRKSLLNRFLSTTIIIPEQAPHLYIQTPTPQTKHNTPPLADTPSNKSVPPTPSSRHRPPLARQHQRASKQRTSRHAPRPALVEKRGGQTNEQRGR